jgi:transcriptional regulator with XRE-family HTH domain
VFVWLTHALGPPPRRTFARFDRPSAVDNAVPMPHPDREGFYRHFGRAVRRARLDQNLTQADLGRPLDLSRASVANIEAGRQHCALHAAVVLADTLDVPLTTLLPDPGEAPLVMADLQPDTDRYRDDIALVLSRAASDTAQGKDSAR